MLMLIDQIAGWTRVQCLRSPHDPHELRTYYIATRPYRALIVCRNNLTLGNLLGQVVDCKAGQDRGDAGFARVPGVPQSKLTIYRPVTEDTRYKLSQWLRRAARDA